MAFSASLDFGYVVLGLYFSLPQLAFNVTSTPTMPDSWRHRSSISLTTARRNHVEHSFHKARQLSTVSKLPSACQFFSFIFFTQVQIPVTLCSGELWSILVVRQAHSADLRSRLRHVSGAPSVAYSTGCSRVVTHPGTNPTRRRLPSVI